MPFSFPFLYAKQLLNVRSFSAPALAKPSVISAKTIWKKTGELQHTISRVITKTGKGLHSGDEAVVRVFPAMAGEGRYFIVNRHEVRVPASVKNVTDTTLSVRIGRGDSSVATVEHLLSALEGMGIDNCRIEVEGGNEVPLLDGSSKEWVEAIEEAGTCIARDNSGNGMEKMALVLCEPIHVLKDESFVTAFPAPSTRITYGIDFPQAAAIGCQWFSWYPVDSMAYKQNVAPSRTFCIYEQIQQLRAAGFIKGGSMDNALVCSIEKGWLNPPLRFPEEPCRHKLLDLIGDLSLCAQNGHQGLPIAHIIAYKASHTLHTKFAGAVLAS